MLVSFLINVYMDRGVFVKYSCCPLSLSFRQDLQLFSLFTRIDLRYFHFKKRSYRFIGRIACRFHVH